MSARLVVVLDLPRTPTPAEHAYIAGRLHAAAAAIGGRITVAEVQTETQLPGWLARFTRLLGLAVTVDSIEQVRL